VIYPTTTVESHAADSNRLGQRFNRAYRSFETMRLTAATTAPIWR
jgi:hypothetical protein